MIRYKHFLAAAALWLGVSAGTAQATQAAAQSCVTAREAEALLLYIAPDMIRETGRICAANLPADALLRSPSGPFLAKYQAEAPAAWPLARRALAKITGPESRQLLDSQFAGPMVSSLMVPMLAANIQPADCPVINRVVTLTEPLPARNAAALIVLLLQLADAGKTAEERQVSRLPLCPLEAK